jgi:hypothetical protein
MKKDNTEKKEKSDLTEITNHRQDFDINDLKIINDEIKSEKADDVEENIETLNFLGAIDYSEIEINGAKIPPPTAGTIAILQIIESPFVVSSEKEILQWDVLEALTVLAMGKDALQIIGSGYKAKQLVFDLQKIAEKSPEHYRILLDKSQSLAEKTMDWQTAIVELGDNLGTFDWQEIGLKISTQINMAFKGLSVLPKSEIDSDIRLDEYKKKAGSTFCGLFQRLFQLPKCLKGKTGKN